MKTLVITILYFASCPNHEQTLKLVKQVLAEKHLTAQIQVIEVKEDEIYKYHFLGSPTVQINGKDIEPARRDAKPVFSCRFYQTKDGLSGVPPKELISAAIDEALGLSKPKSNSQNATFHFKKIE